jgi:hypothetical protein
MWQFMRILETLTETRFISFLEHNYINSDIQILILFKAQLHIAAVFWNTVARKQRIFSKIETRREKELI